MTSQMVMGVLAYGLAINLLGYAAMVLDKAKAENRSRRIPEATLLNLALLGGSVGTVLAQQTIRHKTRKEPFRSKLVGIVVLQVLVLIALAIALSSRDRPMRYSGFSRPKAHGAPLASASHATHGCRRIGHHASTCPDHRPSSHGGFVASYDREKTVSRTPLGSMTQIDLFAELEANMADGVPCPGRVETIERRPARPRLVPAPQLSDEEMASRLEATGRYRILRQLQPRPVRDPATANTAPIAHPVPTARDGERIGLILDTETTGLDHGSHEIIELGMVAFTYDETGIRDVVGTFSAMREPGVPISAEITRITGITAEMVAGQSIDLDAVARFAEPADLVIAHNARFDRPFVERFAPGFDAKPWACSVAEIDWTTLGFEGSKLGYLVGQCGWFHNGHRAVDDCHALLEVLAHRSRTDALDPFHQLVASAARTRLRLYAIGSPFHTKDILKARGYRWSDGTDGRPKCWWREIEEDGHDEEAAFLEHEIYAGENPVQVVRLTACDRFKA